jgi:hypothetical protein
MSKNTHSECLMGTVIKTIRENIIRGITEARQNGLNCSYPKIATITIPINEYGVPHMSRDCEAWGKVQITLDLTP